MTRPVRLQFRRSAGFDLQAYSRSVNGLPARLCTRPGSFGNVYVVDAGRTPAQAVDRYRDLWAGHCPNMYRLGLSMLVGCNLACFCREDAEHCHVDVLLDIFGPLYQCREVPAI